MKSRIFREREQVFFYTDIDRKKYENNTYTKYFFNSLLKHLDVFEWIQNIGQITGK